MRALLLSLFASVLAANSAAAQDRVRVSVDAGQQTTRSTVTQEQSFQQYFEQGSFTFEHSIPKAPFYGAGISVRIWRGLHASAAVSFFEDTATGQVTARVPHPLQFNQPRTTSGELGDITRREIAQHYSAGWLIPAAGGLDFHAFAGPSMFNTEQVFVTGLTLGLAQETFPFTTLAFPGVNSERQTDNVFGYHAGVDMTWRFSRHVGAGLLVRYSRGRKSFTPTNGQPLEIEAGGLHAGGGLRVGF